MGISDDVAHFFAHITMRPQRLKMNGSVGRCDLRQQSSHISFLNFRDVHEPMNMDNPHGAAVPIHRRLHVREQAAHPEREAMGFVVTMHADLNNTHDRHTIPARVMPSSSPQRIRQLYLEGDHQGFDLTEIGNGPEHNGGKAQRMMRLFCEPQTRPLHLCPAFHRQADTACRMTAECGVPGQAGLTASSHGRTAGITRRHRFDDALLERVIAMEWPQAPILSVAAP